MFSKWRLSLAAASAIALASATHAQVASEGMDDISAWGERYLSSSEPDFPSNLWTGSDNGLLLTLLRSLETSELTTAERSLLRRVVLSPAQKATGPQTEELLAERARLMLELGEARAAAALAPRLEPGALGLEAEALAVDLDLASGRDASACVRLVEPVSESVYWLQLRAVCAVLRGNNSGAELAIEVASARGLDDPWFVEAVFAAAGDVPNPPPAKYVSGLSIALSLEADLNSEDLDVADTRPDLAAAIAQRSDIALPMRIKFGELAYANGLIDADTWRDLLDAQFDDPAFEPKTDQDQTLAILLDPLLPVEAQAAALADHLLAATDGRLLRFEQTTRIFAKELAKFEPSEQTLAYAPLFARAAFANGEVEAAQAWLDLAYDRVEEVEEDPVDGLFVDSALSELALEDTSGDAALAAAMIASIDETDPTLDAAIGAPIQLTQGDPVDPETDDPITEDASVETVETVTDDVAEASSSEADAVEQGADEENAVDVFVGEDGTEFVIDTDAPIEPEAPAPLPMTFQEMQIAALIKLSNQGADAEARAEIAASLTAAAVTDAEIEQAVRLINVLPAFDVPLGPDARAFLISQPVIGDGVDPHILAAIESATMEGAFAEAALMMLTQLRNDPEALSAPDLARFVDALQIMRAGDVAAGLVRETSGFWKTPVSDIMVE
ncbi:MAG: hypothetical protein AAGJ84_01100 [Pseudomonadota bacterium]